MLFIEFKWELLDAGSFLFLKKTFLSSIKNILEML
jgi:hypothetical protein